MSDPNSTSAGVTGAGLTAAGVVGLAKTGAPISVVLAIGTTLAALGIVVFLKMRQSAK